MFTILLHSSKTMRPPATDRLPYQRPLLQTQANEIAHYLRTLSPEQLQRCMQLSAAKAEQTSALVQEWSEAPLGSRPAIDAFLGDIYSGLQARSLSHDEREYANQHLLILSGLYGGLRALDSVHPYRLEMGYRLPHEPYANLAKFWGSRIADMIPAGATVLNLSAVEYTKAVLPHLKQTVITPKFMTVSPKTGQPTFVTVHAKIARGAFARWSIKHRISDASELERFKELGYSYSPQASSAESPVFICDKFTGLGLSVRLS